MGCSNSNTKDLAKPDPKQKSKSLINFEKDKFFRLQSALNSIITTTPELSSELLNLEGNQECLEYICTKYKEKFDTAKLSETEVKEALFNACGAEFARKPYEYDLKYFIKEFIVSSLFRGSGIANDVSNELEELFSLSSPNYAWKQKGIVQSRLHKGTENIVRGILNNIKYDSKYNTEVYNFVLSGNLYKEEYVINDIAEVIELSTNITTVCIPIIPDDVEKGEKLDFNSFAPILNAIAMNGKIKAFAIVCPKHVCFSLTEENQKLVLEMFRKNSSLMFGVISKISLSFENYKQLMEIVKQHKSIRGFTWDSVEASKEEVDLFLLTFDKSSTLMAGLMTVSNNHEELKERQTEANAIKDRSQARIRCLVLEESLR